jgi:multiple sugar transport system substrate-binding protein
MKKIIFTVFLMVIVLVVPIVAQGQAEQSDEPVVVSLNTLFHGGDAAAMEMIVEEFNATHDDIQVELTQGGWTDYTAQLNNSVLAGEAPQIATILNFSMSSSLPALLPLNNTPAGDMISLNDFKRDDYVPTVWDIATHNGNQYGIPLDNTMLGIYYNKDIFVKAGLNPEEPPKTLEEFDIAMDIMHSIRELMVNQDGTEECGMLFFGRMVDSF